MKTKIKPESVKTDHRPLKLSDVQLASLLQPMAMLLQAGISPLSAVSLLLQKTRDTRSRDLLSGIRDSLMSGQTLHVSFAQTGVFPDYALKILEIGELTGETDTLMARLGAYYQQRDSRRRSLRNALLYPVIMILRTRWDNPGCFRILTLPS